MTIVNNSFTRFLLVGIFNTFVGLSTVFVFLNLIGLSYWTSTFLGNSIGAFVSYVLNKRFSFKSKLSFRQSFWRFILVIVLSYFLAYSCSLLFTQLFIVRFLSLQDAYVKNIAVVLGAGLYTILNYMGHKYFTFRSKKETGKEKLKIS